MAVTIKDALASARARLRANDPEGARSEAELLLCETLGCARTTLHAWPERELVKADLDAFESYVARRATGLPIAYLTGKREFWSLELDVSSSTLIPRPETEHVVESVLALAQDAEHLTIVDLGTGCGTIALALARERQRWSVLATDHSHAALAVAQGNAKRLKLGNVAFCQSDWCDAIATHSVHLIATNPPYLADTDPHLQRGDLRFEPRDALASGASGMEALQRIARGARRVLRAGGSLVLEHGAEQGARVRTLLSESGFAQPTTRKDLAGHERVTWATLT